MKDLAVSYGIRKKVGQMAGGGMVENEKLSPGHEAHVKSIVEDFFRNNYAGGGMVEPDDASSEMEEMSASGDDFLSHDNDNTDELAMNMMPEGMNESEDGSGIMLEDKKKKILASVMDSFK